MAAAPYKVAILGNSMVGKTAYVERLTVFGNFIKTYEPTQDHSIRQLEFTTSRGPVHLAFCDISGSEVFRTLPLDEDLDLVIVMCSDSPSSIQWMDKWIQKAKDQLGREFPIIKIQNKLDIISKPSDQVDHVISVKSCFGCNPSLQAVIAAVTGWKDVALL